MNPIFILKNVFSKKWCVLALAFLFSANLAFAQDDCSNAEPLVCGDIITGNNEGFDTDALPNCGVVFPGQTVWYTIAGTGGEITASTCSSNTNFDSQIAIYSGSCGFLSCVAGNNNDLGCDNPRLSTVSWDSEAGTTYYVVVAGVLGASGDYELTIDCEAVGPENNQCEDALPISCGDVVSGSTEGASSESLPFCGTSLSSAPGVWYELMGTGGQIEVTTCNAGTNYDTKLGVFSGSCGSLSCVGGDDDDSCPFSSLRSRVVFSSSAGETYYIYVTGFGSNSGDFELSVTCASAVPNDDCSDAIGVSCGDTVSGSTEGASPESVGFCGTSLTSAGGVWYALDGTGGAITVTTCNAGTNYDTKLGVFSGSCGSLVCVGGDDDDSCQFSSLRSRVTFASEEGTTYYILVTGFGSNTGDFELSIDCEEVEDDSNAACEDAVELFCGDVIEGNTSEGSVQDFGSACGSTQNDNISTAPGLWYSFTGNNTLVNLSTCSAASEFDTKIAVFSGSCDGLTCVAVNDNDLSCDASGRLSTVEFAAFAGTTYYVYVTGHQGSNGAFELSVDCSLINDDCDGALPIACGETVTGNTDEASSDSFPACGTSNFGAPGAWYQTVGTGLEITASLCGSNYDTKLWIFEGTCGSLVCVNGNDDFCGLDSQVSWDSDDGTTYYILVSGFSSSSSGDFILDLECEDDDNGGGDDNDLCDGATEILCGETVTGSTADGATSDDAPAFCGTSLTSSAGRWYSFTGIGDDVTVTTCNPGTNYDTKLGVFSGSCGALVCVGGNDDQTGGTDPACVVPETGSSFNRASTVSFTALSGVTYYIYVTGFSTSTGEYELSIDCGVNLTDEPSGLVQDNDGPRLDASKYMGTDEAAVGNFYPNPVQFGSTNIEIYAPQDQIARIQLFDNMGRLARNVEVELYNGVNTVELQLGDLPIGTYFANITLGEFADRKKLIIAK